MSALTCEEMAWKVHHIGANVMQYVCKDFKFSSSNILQLFLKKKLCLHPNVIYNLKPGNSET